MGRGLEVGVAQAAATAPGDERPLAGRDEVRDELTGRVVENGRAGRDGQVEVLAGLAVTPGTFASATRLRLEMVRVTEVAQRRLPGVDAKVDGATSPAVSAIGTAAGHVGFPPEGRRP